MVNFSVFNELSLPLRDISEFELFFELLENLRDNGLNKIRMDKKFTQYPEILPSTTFEELIGKISKDKKRKLLNFIKDRVNSIESPLIKDDENEQRNKITENEYFYKGKSIQGGLASCDIWNTITVSFASHQQWETHQICLAKETLLENGYLEKKDIEVPNLSNLSHIEQHTSFFEAFEKDRRLGFNTSNFWKRHTEIFNKKIFFVSDVETQIEKLDSRVFEKSLSILHDLEISRRVINDFDISGEGETVKKNSALRKLREFKIDEKIEFFEKHIKNLPNGYRIYFFERGNKIYIGYIGKHLSTKKH